MTSPHTSPQRAASAEEADHAAALERVGQVRTPPRWPRNWANFSLLSLYSHSRHRNA
jgi:hypothetical protein